MASIYLRGQGSVSEAICREFSNSDGKVRINTPEKAERYLEILRERGYKALAIPAIEEKRLQNEHENKEK